MTNSTLEWAIIAFIVLTIGWVVWKGGAANPMGTGRLSREITKLTSRVRQTEKELAELKEEAATTKDIARLEARMEGQRELSERTNRGVERIENYLIEKGLNGK